MENIDGSICTGTSGYEMDQADLLLFEGHLRPKQRGPLDVAGLDRKQDTYNTAFVKINLPATGNVREHINALLDQEGLLC